MEYQFTSSPSKPTVAPTPFLTTTGTPNTILGTVLINISLIFENLINLPTRDMVLKAAIVNLKTKLRTARDITAQKLNEPIVTKNLTYYSTGSNSFLLNVEFKIHDVSFSAQCNANIDNSTYTAIQQEINALMTALLSAPQTTTISFPSANYTCNKTQLEIVANQTYRYKEGDIPFPSSFLYTLLKESGLVYYTMAPLVTIQPTPNPENGTSNVAWILGFIIPIAILLILLPCWILLCCILCGCCAGVRKRWSRRRSYNVRSYDAQYQTHNSLF
ncbi:uncharacterized protein LOC128528606 [Clarias gariepinus]|uniref:uncharacterized protein LOC128528606 n=1 Tax=Clarias gariepinus TaxID=13013 RepID=UPI00234C2711|nr:uncharacterized protein LOC128528606 [Clarias gariepinus]